MKHVKVLIVAATFIFVTAMVSMLFVGGTKAQTPANAGDKAERKTERLERVKVSGENIVQRTTIRVDRIEQLNTKAGEIAVKMEQKGKDVAQARAFFATATEKIALARTGINEASALVSTATDTLKLIESLKAKLGEVYRALNEARQNTLQGIQVLKGAAGAKTTATIN